MPLPSMEELTDAFAVYVNTPKTANQFVGKSVETAVSYILSSVGEVGPVAVVDGYVTPSVETVAMPTSIYEEEVMMLAADLFYRRQAQHGIITVDEMTGTPVRVAQDPYKNCDIRIARWLGPGFA